MTVVRTVRFRITVVASVVVALVLAVVGVAVLVVQERQLSDDLDESLRRRTDELAADDLDIDDGAVIVISSAAGDDVVIQVVSSDRVVAATENAMGIAPIAPDPPNGADSFTTVSALPVEDDEFRILSRRTTLDGRAAVVHVAESTDDLRDLLAQLRIAVAVLIPIAVVILGALVWWLVGRTLRPVERIRAEVAGFEPTQLDRRVSAPGTGDEIDRLATTMNEMLDRLEDASRRQQQFVADASHELRSPLTRMRTELETASPGRPDDIGASVQRSVLEEIDELTELVDDLLVLARSDAGRAPVERRPVDLDDLVFDEVAAIRRSGTDVTIDVAGVSAAEVDGAPEELRRVIRNLLDNATRHASSRVELTLDERTDAQPDDADDGSERSDDVRHAAPDDGVVGGGGSALLTVTDDGPGVPVDRSEAVFERFGRLDGARTRRTGGSGLGLAIARDIVERHGGTLRLDTAYRTGARFVLRLPSNVTRS